MAIAIAVSSTVNANSEPDTATYYHNSIHTTSIIGSTTAARYTTTACSLSPAEELRQTLMRFPQEKRMIIDENIIAVIGIGGDLHDLTETRARIGLAIYDVPSLSLVGINISNTVTYSRFSIK